MRLFQTFLSCIALHLCVFKIALGAQGDFCALNRDCNDKFEFCQKDMDAQNGTCTFQDCDSLNIALQTRLGMPLGDLICSDYTGDFPGLVFLCGDLDFLTNLDQPYNVDLSIAGESQGSTEKILVGDEVLLRKWERECTSSTPTGDVFTCFDNKGADYTAFRQEALALGLDQTQECLASDKDPSYRSPVIHRGFDFLFGGGADIQVDFKGDTVFDERAVDSAVYAYVVPEGSAGGTNSAGHRLYLSSPLLFVGALTFLF